MTAGPALNVAETWVGTRALGPGLRSVVWVQGCPFDCAGCLAPDWIPDRPARAVRPEALADELLADPEVTGLTLSGGEPMAQAAGLAALVRAARAVREVSVIAFTGYRLARLTSRPPGPGVAELLAEVDVLIDGRYVAALDDGRGLRGSRNQVVHRLTDRLAGVDYDFTGRPREAEIAVRGPSALLVGVPPRGLLPVFEAAVHRARRTGLGPTAGTPTTHAPSTTDSTGHDPTPRAPTTPHPTGHGPAADDHGTGRTQP